jgi:hypothetical protein
MATKKCGKCGCEMYVSEFSKNKSTKDGRQAWCKACSLSHKAEYSKTDAGKANERRSTAKYNKKNTTPGKIAAQFAVSKAIRNGDLEKASELECFNVYCKKNALDWHHHSYREEDHLNVTPYCRKCHRAWHRLNEVIHAS